MFWENLSKIGLAAIPVLGAIIELLRSATATRRLRTELEALQNLPKESRAYAAWDAYLCGRIAQLERASTELRRNPYTVIWGLIFGLPAIYVGYLALTQSGFWWLAVTPLAIVSIAAFADGLQKKKRDENGRVITEASD